MARPSNPFFNAHHSPVGAFASLTLGLPGSRGGFGLELAGPADAPFFCGLETASEPGAFAALPFFEPTPGDASRFEIEQALPSQGSQKRVDHFSASTIARDFGPAIDAWTAGDLSLSIASPNWPMAGMRAGQTDEEAARSLRPSLSLRLRLDNSAGSGQRRWFLGYTGAAPHANTRPLHHSGLTGIAQGAETGLAVRAQEGISTAFGFTIEQALDMAGTSNSEFYIGQIAVITGVVEPGQVLALEIAAAFHRSGIATTGIPAQYRYLDRFPTLESVLDSALADSAAVWSRAEQEEAELAESGLSETRQLLVSAALRSYNGSTQLLRRLDTGADLVVVNEGEYRMMNTFDLQVDHMFHELDRHPRVLQNVLELFAERYSYTDEVWAPGDEEARPGGLSFTHDMGVGNHFSRPGYSSYERAGLKGCFSYMTGEQLLNWLLCSAALFEHGLIESEAVNGLLEQAVESLERRDPLDRGMIGADSSRCEGGAEITTYDSLDPSLGQTRNNLYMAVKAIAAAESASYTAGVLGREDLGARLKRFAERGCASILAARNADGTFPAVLYEGVEARIIPAIEGLAYLVYDGYLSAEDLSGKRTGHAPEHILELARALRGHLEAVLVPGVCLFPDGGWKLSSTSDNSWLSKIFLCQWVAEELYGMGPFPEADEAHWRWISEGDWNGYWCFSDQILAGRAEGSKYYPRGVTSWLWVMSARARNRAHSPR